MSTTISKEQIETRLTAALVEFGADESEITPDAKFEALDVDSLDLVEMAQIAEDEWGVVIKTEDMKDLLTLGDAVDLVEARAA